MIKELKRRLPEWNAEKKILQNDIETLEKRLDKVVEIKKIREKAKWCFSEAVIMTKREVKEIMDPLVTSALQGIFQEEDYTFVSTFEIKAGRPICVMQVQDGDKEPFYLEEDMGGGLLDIAGIAVIVVMWILEEPRSRNSFLLDEPMKNIGIGKEVLLERAGQLLSELSKELNIQFIINTHEQEIVAISDKAWEFDKINGRSVVTQIKPEVPVSSGTRLIKRQA